MDPSQHPSPTELEEAAAEEKSIEELRSQIIILEQSVYVNKPRLIYDAKRRVDQLERQIKKREGLVASTQKAGTTLVESCLNVRSQLRASVLAHTTPLLNHYVDLILYEKEKECREVEKLHNDHVGEFEEMPHVQAFRAREKEVLKESEDLKAMLEELEELKREKNRPLDKTILDAMTELETQNKKNDELQAENYDLQEKLKEIRLKNDPNNPGNIALKLKIEKRKQKVRAKKEKERLKSLELNYVNVVNADEKKEIEESKNLQIQLSSMLSQLNSQHKRVSLILSADVKMTSDNTAAISNNKSEVNQPAENLKISLTPKHKAKTGGHKTPQTNFKNVNPSNSKDDKTKTVFSQITTKNVDPSNSKDDKNKTVFSSITPKNFDPSNSKVDKTKTVFSPITPKNFDPSNSKVDKTKTDFSPITESPASKVLPVQDEEPSVQEEIFEKEAGNDNDIIMSPEDTKTESTVLSQKKITILENVVISESRFEYSNCGSSIEEAKSLSPTESNGFLSFDNENGAMDDIEMKSAEYMNDLISPEGELISPAEYNFDGNDDSSVRYENTFADSANGEYNYNVTSSPTFEGFSIDDDAEKQQIIFDD